MWNVIDYPFPKLNSEVVEVWEWIINFLTYFYLTCNCLSMLGLELNQLSKRVPRVIAYHPQELGEKPLEISSTLCCKTNSDGNYMHLNDFYRPLVEWSTVKSERHPLNNDANDLWGLNRGRFAWFMIRRHDDAMKNEMYPDDWKHCAAIWKGSPKQIALFKLWLSVQHSRFSCGGACLTRNPLTAGL